MPNLRSLRRVPRAARAVLTAACVVASGAACVDWSGPDGDTDAYSIARSGWEETSPSAYEYTLQRTCSCPAERTQAVTITVRDGAVTERRYVSGGAAVPAAEEQYFSTIDALFDELRLLLDGPSSQEQVFYNGAWGYPYFVTIVPSAGSGQSIVGWQITNWRQI